jgi:bacterioferritin-associated ferredoxin
MNELNPEILRFMRPPVVCLCRQVSADQLKTEIRQGALTFEELQKRTSCSTVCGTCEGRVRELLKNELDALRYFPASPVEDT